MDLVKAGQIALIMLSPTLAVAAAIGAARAGSALARRHYRRAHPAVPRGRPIEQIAADLGRLLRERAALRRAGEVAVRGQRLRALDAAITDCADEAAEALDVRIAAPTGRETPAARQLRLLRALAEAGLVLPPGTLLVHDRRP